MFHHPKKRRSIGETLRDRRGSGVAEGVAGAVIAVIAAATLGLGFTGDLKAVSTIATKAERQAMVTSLVGDVHAIGNWGTPSAPQTQTMTLPNGHQVTVTTWRVDTPVSTTLTAVAPISSTADAADCSGPSALAKTGCIYATRLHALTLDNIEPFAIVRKDPSMGNSSPIGTVDPRVSTTTSIPQGTTFASGTDGQATVWRYLVTAHSTESNGYIQITQAGITLARFPVDAADNNYFGTFVAALNTPVTATVTSGNVVVDTVFIYRAGSTS